MGGIDEYLLTLTDLGLSTTQAKVYLTLMDLKAQTAQEISKASGVARPYVYEVLAELERDGYVERIISKPERFQPVPLGSCVSSLIQKRKRKTTELQKKASVLTETFRRSIVQKEPEEKFQFVLLPAKTAISAKTEEMLKNVQKGICYMGLRQGTVAWLSSFRPFLEEALSRKVNCRIIMPYAKKEQIDEPLKELNKHPHLTLRTIQQQPKVRFSVWDQKEVLIRTSTTNTPIPFPTLWSNNKAIVDLSKDYFEYTWEKAKKKQSEA